MRLKISSMIVCASKYFSRLNKVLHKVETMITLIQFKILALREKSDSAHHSHLKLVSIGKETLLLNKIVLKMQNLSFFKV